MEIKILEYFLAIAQEKSISAAARKLHVTQPTLSRQLKVLEEDLGTELFVRNNHELVITPAGQLYQKRSEQIIYLIEQTNKDVRTLNAHNLIGTISIGCTQTNIADFMADVISRFHSKFPSVKIDVYDLSVDDIKMYLDQRVLDVGFIMRPAEIEKYAELSLDDIDQWGVILPASSKWSTNASLTVEDLKQIPLLVPRNVLIQSNLLMRLGLSSLDLNILGKQNLVTNSLKLVRANVAGCFCAKGALPAGISDLNFVPIEKLPSITHSMIWRRETHLREPLTRFIELTKLVSESDGE